MPHDAMSRIVEVHCPIAGKVLLAACRVTSWYWQMSAHLTNRLQKSFKELESPYPLSISPLPSEYSQWRLFIFAGSRESIIFGSVISICNFYMGYIGLCPPWKHGTKMNVISPFTSWFHAFLICVTCSVCRTLNGRRKGICEEGRSSGIVFREASKGLKIWGLEKLNREDRHTSEVMDTVIPLTPRGDQKYAILVSTETLLGPWQGPAWGPKSRDNNNSVQNILKQNSYKCYSNW